MTISREDKLLIASMSEAVNHAKEMVIEETSKLSGAIERIKPFFISFSACEPGALKLELSRGSVVEKKEDRNEKQRLSSRAELRLGSPTLGGHMEKFTPEIPFDRDPDYLKRFFWVKANEAMYDAREAFGKKISKASHRENKLFTPFSFFSEEKIIKDFLRDKKIEVDLNFWIDVLKPVSKLFERKEIVISKVLLDYTFEKFFYVNSEGTQIIESFPVLSIKFRAGILGKNNLIFGDQKSFYFNDLDTLPTQEALMIAAEEFIRDLYEIKDAPFQTAGAFPTILDSANSGFMLHEMLHSAEGIRPDEDQRDDEEDIWGGSEFLLTFKGKIGERVAPEFLSVYDDPGLFEGFVNSRYDAEGIPMQKTKIIEKGVLKNFLHSRESAGFFTNLYRKKFRSNGHARSDITANPIPRMTNLVLDSKKEHSMDELKEMLFRQCHKDGKKFGLLLKGNLMGEAMTGSIKFTPRHIFRLYPNGRIKRVKGVYVHNSPHQMLENIVATSNEHGFCRGICGAESGYLPVCEKTPDVFVKQVGFEKIPLMEYENWYPFLLPSPV